MSNTIDTNNVVRAAMQLRLSEYLILREIIKLGDASWTDLASSLTAHDPPISLSSEVMSGLVHRGLLEFSSATIGHYFVPVRFHPVIEEFSRTLRLR